MLAMYLIGVLLFQRLRKHQSLSMNVPQPGGVGDPFLNRLLIRTGDKFQTSQQLHRLPLKINVQVESKMSKLTLCCYFAMSAIAKQDFCYASPEHVAGNCSLWQIVLSKLDKLVQPQ